VIRFGQNQNLASQKKHSIGNRYHGLRKQGAGRIVNRLECTAYELMSSYRLRILFK